jgi:hypothetical protein
MTIKRTMTCGLTAAALAGSALPALAQSDSLTLCWAAWDPANALVELSKDFTAESGIAMNFEFVPWPNFADRILNELNAGGQLCDLLIGDSQWIGGSAENGITSSSTTSSRPKASRWTTSCRRPSTPIRPGRRARRTTGRCRRWATRSAGSTARTGSRTPRSWQPSRRRPGASSRRPRPGTSSSRSPSSSRAARSTARRSTARRSSPSAARRASPWAPPRRSTPTASSTRPSRAATTWTARSTRRRRSAASRCTRPSTSAARRRATPTPTWARAWTRSNPARSP